MKKKNWLELATNPDRDGLQNPHGCFAADGFRLHIDADASVECDCGNEKIHNGLNNIITMVERTPFAFIVNKNYLIDALSGMNDDGDAVIFFISRDSKQPIVIQDSSGCKTAIIMPIHINGRKDGKQVINEIPRLKTTKVKKAKAGK